MCILRDKESFSPQLAKFEDILSDKLIYLAFWTMKNGAHEMFMIKLRAWDKDNWIHIA